MLFNGSNTTASANNLEWKDKQWRIVNHFTTYTEAQVKATTVAKAISWWYMAGKTFSAEASSFSRRQKNYVSLFGATDDAHSTG